MSRIERNVRKPRWSVLIAALPVTVFAAIAAAFLWGLFNNEDSLPSTMIDRDIPEFDLPPSTDARTACLRLICVAKFHW
ncbi:hypothetical protein [Sulfitobacter profundi]|uniref:Uncharacterized protein n=1 Tax=Sulfitobacter profundi TaxID=2679961 RepID=A0ABW1Z3Z5_9RHOB